MKKIKSISVAIILLSVLFLLTGCLTFLATALSSQDRIDESVQSAEYLFSNIVPFMEDQSKEEILTYISRSGTYFDRPVISVAGDNSVIVGSIWSPFQARVTKDGISFQFSFDLFSYSSFGKVVLYLMDGTKELGSVNVSKYVTSTSNYDSYYGKYSYTGKLTDYTLPEKWTDILISYGDGKHGTDEFLRIVSGDKEWSSSLGTLNDDSVLRIAYLIKQSFKNYSNAKQLVSVFLKSNGSLGHVIQSAIDRGKITLGYDSSLYTIKADNIVMKTNGNSHSLFLHDNNVPSGVCYINVFCNEVPFWISDASSYISGKSFDYPLSGSDLYQQLRNSSKCSIDYYDANFNTIDSKSIIFGSDNDQLLMSIFSYIYQE